MPEVTEVEVGAVDPERFDAVLDKEQVASLDDAIDGRTRAVRRTHHLERQLDRQGRRRR